MDHLQVQGLHVPFSFPLSLPQNDRVAYLRRVDFAVNQLSNNKATLLASIPLTEQPSSAPLSVLSAVLAAVPGPWPIFDLLCCYARLWKHLPEAAKSGKSSNDLPLLEQVSNQIRATYTDLASLFPSNDRPAIHDANSSSTLSHRALSSFLRTFRLPVPQTNRVVAIALPNGPLLALALLATATYYTAAPVSVSSGAEQFRNDVLQSAAKVILATPADVSRLGLRESWVLYHGIEVVLLESNQSLTFNMNRIDGGRLTIQDNHTPNAANDVGLILFTSGTSGTKKVVPMSVHSILSGVSFVIESWGLSEDDVCLNMMPLFHVGGIVRNLFAPILAGGSTVCCPAFDPNLFWDVVEDKQPTWYYASPTMHSAILEEGQNRPEALAKSNIRLICNAAGGLLPSLACSLRDTFHCIVLPSYGMTECMPISTPPLDYELDRPGTSGISVGPEMAILDGNGQHLLPHNVGRISVRGAPVFEGYLKGSGVIDKSPFTDDGWFDTGDMGYLDQDGYLYVTGRSKEVINRGGELISPFEVEEAVVTAARREGSPTYGRISAALAFSMPHSVLQEVVGLAVVTPPGSHRVDIQALQDSVADSLNQIKWPVFLVFMDALPKNNNKIVRIKLAERLGLKDISDETPPSERHYEATCPPPDTPLSKSISCSPCRYDSNLVIRTMEDIFGSDVEVFVRPAGEDRRESEAIIAPRPSTATTIAPETLVELQRKVAAELDYYMAPRKFSFFDEPLPRSARGSIDSAQVDSLLQAKLPSGLIDDSSMSPTESKIAHIFSQILICPLSSLSSDSDFFQMGGDSLRAGRLVSELRKEFKIRLPIDLLFTHGRIESLARNIDERVQETSKEASAPFVEIPLDNQTNTVTYSSTNPFLMLLQLFPIALLYPMKRALTWTIFMYMLTATQSWATTHTLIGRLVNLILCLGIGRAITRLIVPLVGISLKWIIIGRIKEGVYPMWGSYHTRWWLVQKILQVTGRGHFGSYNSTLILYYRMLGARIGSGVKIATSATLGEYDLLEIADGANLDKCICRGFAAEQNTHMYLGKIRVGKDSSVGLNSIVAPGTTLPDGACIGPNSSSWETKDADESNRELSANRVPGAHWVFDLFLSIPTSLLVTLVQAGPWIGGLVGLVMVEPGESDDQVRSTIEWFAAPHRIGFHYLALILNSYFGPMAWFLAVFALKKLLDASIGKTRPGPAARRSELQKWRMAVLKKIAPVGKFHKLLEIFGSHYEFTSILYRAMGAKVGSRVYWPGTGPFFQDFDLMDIGNDVVFGSRAHIITSDGSGSDVVKVGNGAMIADRVVLLPGASVGEQTVLGSGALTRRNKHYPSNTVWIGSQQNEAVCLSGNSSSTDDTMNETLEKKTTRVTITAYDNSEYSSDDSKPSSSASSAIIKIDGSSTSSSPFGRAFYEGKASYYVFGLSTIFLYSSFITIFTAFYWNVSPTSSIQVVSALLALGHHALAKEHWYRPLVIYALFTLSIAILMAAQAILALALVIASKWILLGRRQPGNYDWDKSPYCQRWQLFLTIEKLRRHCYGGHGILGLLTGTHYAVLYFRALGATIGKDCALFAGGLPSLMFTEPDLLTLGDRVAVDDASLVSHINSRGVFNLNRLSVGDRSVLRSGSRLLSGAQMGKDSVLLEHTLVMAGDVADEGCTYQGWPADVFHRSRTPSRAPSIKITHASMQFPSTRAAGLSFS